MHTKKRTEIRPLFLCSIGFGKISIVTVDFVVENLSGFSVNFHTIFSAAGAELQLVDGLAVVTIQLGALPTDIGGVAVLLGVQYLPDDIMFLSGHRGVFLYAKVEYAADLEKTGSQ